MPNIIHISPYNFRQIVQLLKKLNSFDYKLIDINGKEVDEDDPDLVNKYRLQSPEYFLDRKAGVCWDYTAYEAAWFDSHLYLYKTFYINYHKDDEYDYSHTFLVFYSATSCFYFESSWGRLQGIWKADNENDILGFVMHEHARENDILWDVDRQRCCFEYDALDESCYGMNASEFPDYVFKHGREIPIPKVYKTPRRMNLEKNLVEWY